MCRFKKKLTMIMISILIVTSLPVHLSVSANQDLGYPEFKGSDNPVPKEPVPYTVNNMMKEIYDKEKDGTDFWMDRLLARKGDDPAGDWLMTRGRALFMKTHNPEIIGFGGSVAYWESIDDNDAYSIEVGNGDFTESVSERLQAPSYWKSEFSNKDGIYIVMKKFITNANVAVTNLEITNNNSSKKTIDLEVSSNYTTDSEGEELTGRINAYNNLTTIYPRLSGDDLTVKGTNLTGVIEIEPGSTVSTKVVMGFVTEEIEDSLSEYYDYKEYTPQEAFTSHVKHYNKWWAENLPYIDVPEDNIKKQIYYRWWLLRYNYLDANMPGNFYQFPTSIEGVLGYNNAIDLTIGMFIQDLKYLRNPIYSYGPWVSAGEVSENGAFRDNPGQPNHWSASHTQYISEAAWESYLIHGGQSDIIRNFAHYAEKDLYGQLADWDSDGNGLIDTNWNAWTGNDADALSFDYYGRANDRTETAYLYSNALAAAEAYEMLDNQKKANEMIQFAEKIQEAVLSLLWDDDEKVFKHRDVETGKLIPWKEINNYYPFSVGLVPNDENYKEAFKLWSDANEYPIFPFFTANQADKTKAAKEGIPGTNNFSIINSTVNFRLFGSAIRDYETEYITEEMYKKLLYWNAYAHYVDGNNEHIDANEFWADYNKDTQQIEYRSWIHHTLLGTTNWTIIEDVAGLRTRTDHKIEINPIDIGWDHFTINNLKYRGNDMTIIWDKPDDGEKHYGDIPEGYSIYINGKRMVTVDSLTNFIWDPKKGEVDFPKDNGTVEFTEANGDMVAPKEVYFKDTDVVDMFQKAGIDLTGTEKNLALGAKTDASYTDPKTKTDAAVNGFTINQPIWGSKGSGNDRDWFEIEFEKETTFDDVRLYFYNEMSDNGYSEPSMYTIQYYDGDDWVDIQNQHKNYPYPMANYNKVQFSPVTSKKLRVLMTHRAGNSTGLKEVQVFHTGVAPQASKNKAPKVEANQEANYSIPLQAKLIGSVKDDGLPNGTIEATWSLIDGPGDAVFSDPNELITTVDFSEAGNYTIKLQASDGELTSTDQITVIVNPIPDQVNVSLDGSPSASYTSGHEDVNAINDGIDPPRSNDNQNPRHGTWPQEGEQWVQLEWDYPVKVDKSDIYFFDDNGGVRIPASWKIQYWDGDSFVDVKNASEYTTEIDQYNTVTFEPVVTAKLRLVMQSGKASVGVLEWKNYSDHPIEIKPIHIPTLVGKQPELPITVQKVYADGEVLEANVKWDSINPTQIDSSGTSFKITGTVDGTYQLAEATVYVRESNAVNITNLSEENITTVVGVPPVLPKTVIATYNDGSKDNVNNKVTWEAIDPSSYSKPGTFTVTGTVKGTEILAKANITVTKREEIPESIKLIPGNSELSPGDSTDLRVVGIMSDGQEIDLKDVDIDFVSDQPEKVIFIDQKMNLLESIKDISSINVHVNITINGTTISSDPIEIQVIYTMDLVELEKVIKKAKKLLDNAVIGNESDEYPESSTEELSKAIVNAEEILSDDKLDQNTINKAVESLKRSIKDFEDSKNLPKPDVVDTKSLEKLIKEAKNLLTNVEIGSGEGEYPESSVDKLSKAIASAEDVLLGGALDQIKVEKTVENLKSSIDDFKASKNLSEPDIIDTKQLEKLIKEAEELLSKAKIGTGDGEFPETSSNKLMDAIAAAKSILADKSINQKALDNAIDTLKQAVEKFNDSMNVVAEDLDGDQTTNEEGKEIPKTATSMYNWLLIGFVTSVLGAVLIVLNRKKRKFHKNR